jgi:repressor LexA
MNKKECTQMGNLYENIIRLCDKQGIKGAKLCTDTGISKGLLTDLKMGRRTGVSAVTAQKIASYFGVSVGYLLGEEESNVERAADVAVRMATDPKFAETIQKRGVRIPVYGNVAAGIPIEAITDIDDYEEITQEMASNGEYIALRIHGDSMSPRMTDGDIIIVRLQDDVDSGDTAVVMINGGDATCKKIKKTEDGVMLISTNPQYEPMFFSNKDIIELPIRVLGKVVELRAKF